ncbi:MAG: hypothetical protein H6819_06660 [Phycisphaerales bacterium]|nr:hypothetical protein [Phycisphaerales bacterium]MCB9855262.1 hypothetical protein [Phycisphaerales bacterium]MCB9862855.1 hypothetical protein [Phycisphaerales bacterium]
MPTVKLPAKNNRLAYRGQRLLSNCCCGDYFECGCCFPGEFGIGSICEDFPNPGGRAACEAAGGVPYLLRWANVLPEEWICIPCGEQAQILARHFDGNGIVVAVGNISILEVQCGDPPPPCTNCLDLQPFPDIIAVRMPGRIKVAVPACDSLDPADELYTRCCTCGGSPTAICGFMDCWPELRNYYTAVINSLIQGTIGNGAIMQRQEDQPCCWVFAAEVVTDEAPCIVEATTEPGEPPPQFSSNIFAEFCVGPCGPFFSFSVFLGSGWAQLLPCFRHFIDGWAGIAECEWEDPTHCAGVGCSHEDEPIMLPPDEGSEPTTSIFESSGGIWDWDTTPQGVALPWNVTVSCA